MSNNKIVSKDNTGENNENFGFDPTSLVKVVLENKELGLALLQIPITLVDNWLNNSPTLEWKPYPTTIGYYWISNSKGLTAIAEITKEYIEAVNRGDIKGYKHAGPLIPPRG